MLRRLRVLRHLKLSEFGQALALDLPFNKAKKLNAWHAWAYYRLGMYATVAKLPFKKKGSHNLTAHVVSLAACGHHDRARNILSSLQPNSLSNRWRVLLADALAPFMPKDALHILGPANYLKAPALYVALLLKTGQADQAKSFISKATQQGLPSRYPELWLYQTMAVAGSDTPHQQLQRLNAFLAHQQVPPLVLLDAETPPGPCNVGPAVAAKPISGPLVSVLMTTYNTGKRASVAIASLLQQSYQNLEIIVVDDASQDNTPDLVQQWCQKDGRVKLLRLTSNVGTYVAKSMALKVAQGEFITCHDSDDWSHPLKIERQVQPLLHDASLIVTTSDWVRMQDDGLFYARPVHPLKRINPSSPLFRKKAVLQQAGAWDSVRTGADSEFIARLRLVFGKKAIKRIRQPLALGAHRPDSLMTASDTGYSDTGLSPQRLDYWESWSCWHLQALANGHPPRLPQDLLSLATNRPFAAPKKIIISPPQVNDALQQADRANQLFS